MAQIRVLEIKNFRSIRDLIWHPSPGFNCLIGAGDSGKSTILDAIDFCLGARRTVQFTDADFCDLDVRNPIEITVTLGGLSERLKSLDAYGQFLRGLHPKTFIVEDEPGFGLETVICLKLKVAADLEPEWLLTSERAEALGLERGLAWVDRQAIAPTRIGSYSDLNLSWKRGSVLNKLSDEKPDASAILLSAAREAREQFGTRAQDQLEDTLATVKSVALDLGIGDGGDYFADLDAHSVSISAGTISLHDSSRVPVRSMGIGSTRLLIAGLQKEASEGTSTVLVDEVEHGLEPHRIIRFLGALGAKDADPKLQIFMTSHSPVVVRELSVGQLTIVRHRPDGHTLRWVGEHPDLQGTLRVFPEALLAKSVLVCEGASEVGFMRGLDLHASNLGMKSLHAAGTALISGGGDEMLKRAQAFTDLGYRTALLRDDDKPPNADLEQAFLDGGGRVFKWRSGKKIEAEIFDSIPPAAVRDLLQLALNMHEPQVIQNQLNSASSNMVSVESVFEEVDNDAVSQTTRIALGVASGKKPGWFKNVRTMEYIADRIIISRRLELDREFMRDILAVRRWTLNV